jgi:glycosyltransferase involved in cell wall biosynthesis
MKKLIIIPAYNESANIKNTVENIINIAPDFDLCCC